MKCCSFSTHLGSCGLLEISKPLNLVYCLLKNVYSQHVPALKNGQLDILGFRVDVLGFLMGALGYWVWLGKGAERSIIAARGL